MAEAEPYVIHRISEAQAFANVRTFMDGRGEAIDTYIIAWIRNAIDMVDFEQVLQWSLVRNAIVRRFAEPCPTLITAKPHLTTGSDEAGVL